jgi:hypothetical protein
MHQLQIFFDAVKTPQGVSRWNWMVTDTSDEKWPLFRVDGSLLNPGPSG